MGPLDHLPIIEAIALHLEFQDMKSLLWVSRNCAKCFRLSGKIKERVELLGLLDELDKERIELLGFI